jgi:pimeloyl-ACP methyl ester carboxylesterase
MVGEAGFTRIPAFEDRYRVIAPDYAHVSTAAQLLDGLAGVLDAEGVRAAHVLGPSYGGLVAQCFVRRHPERVQTLILANTLVPPRRLLWLSKVFLALLPLVPLGWLRALRERTLARAFSGVPSVHISANTAKFHVQHVIEKLGVSDRTEAAYRAAELGLPPASTDEE